MGAGEFVGPGEFLLVAILQVAFGIALAGDLWACTVVLWLLWLGVGAGAARWRKWALCFPLLALAGLSLWALL